MGVDEEGRTSSSARVEQLGLSTGFREGLQNRAHSGC